MKLLTLVRHAQAEDHSADNSDFSRILTGKGIKQSASAGTFIRENNIVPDLILSSPAPRALQTAEIICSEFSYTIDQIKTDMRIYQGDENTLLDLICETPAEINHLLICGHNPSLHLLSNIICNTKRNHFKKGYVLVLIFKINDWSELFNSTGKEKYNFDTKN